MDRRPKKLVFGIVAPPEQSGACEVDWDEVDAEALVAALPHLPRYKDKPSVWKIFQAGLKPPIPGRLR